MPIRSVIRIIMSIMTTRNIIIMNNVFSEYNDNIDDIDEDK